MKHLYFFLTLIIITSCVSTKKATQVSSKKNEVIQNDVLTSLDSIEKVEIIKTEEKSVDEKNTESINQVASDTLKKETTEPVESHKELTKNTNSLHELWKALLKKHVSKEGNVNYKALKNNHKDLLEYIEVLQLSIPNEKNSKEEKLAYWINAYNVFTIDLILRNYPLKSIKDIKDPWGQRLWKLGNKWYNLEEVEHQILRKMNEPRIHFAIVCASYSCPKLLNEAYTDSNLELQLTNATKDFLADKKRNNFTVNNLELSKIFQWFSKDFKQDGSLIDFLNKYSAIKISNKAKTSFNEYNWDLNE